ncbi:MAG: CsgG/HfaB family protein [Rickettsiales bacterium]
MKKALKIALGLPLLALTGCNGYFGNYWTHTDNYAAPIGQSEVTGNDTVYTKELKCLSAELKQKHVTPDVMTIGRVLDFTGKDDIETGRRLTQGATLMMISALDKVGVPQVERFDTSVNEFELKMKDNKLIKNSIEGDERAYQPILAGSIVGSKYTIMGGITELNYNIRSNDVNALFDIASGGMRYYVMNVAMDFRLVETDTLKIVSTVSYQKQIIGREVQAGVFKFFENKLLDVGVGERSLEPIQLAVRSISELAVYELLGKLYGTSGDSCRAAALSSEPMPGWIKGGL